jgi:hypothetical protein
MYLRVASGRTEAIQYPVQTINPEGYLTGFNETMAESAFHWQDDSRNFIKRADIQKLFDASIGHQEARLDPTEMINAMVSIVPADTGKFRCIGWTHTV